MRIIIFIFSTMFFSNKVFGQLEITTGYAVNKNLADGVALSLGYDVKLKNRIYTKSQLGYKNLYHFNDYVGAILKVNIAEIHQTFSYEIIKKNKFILKPNIGVNYRFYNWKGEMKPPYNSIPQRAYNIGFRNDRLRLNSFNPIGVNDGNFSDSYIVNNFGYSIQIQTQFKIKNKLWLHITPFLEPDYDGSQNTGGLYVGIILKKI